MIHRCVTGDPYDEIGGIIESACEHGEYPYSTFAVTVLVDGRESTEIMYFDFERCVFVWDIDWWEGERDVQLLGYCPIDEIHIYGTPRNAILK